MCDDKDIYNLLQEKPLTTDEKSYPILKTLLSANSRSEPDAPPVATEFIVTDLSARRLAFYLQNY